MTDVVEVPLRELEVRQLIAFTKDLLTVEAGVALPPGARVEAVLATGGDGVRLRVLAKVVTVQSVADDGYRYRLRVHSLSRAERDKVQVMLTMESLPR